MNGKHHSLSTDAPPIRLKMLLEEYDGHVCNTYPAKAFFILSVSVSSTILLLISRRIILIVTHKLQ